MSASPAIPAWRLRVAELLDDPVGQAVLRRDRLTRDEVLRQMAAAVERINHDPEMRKAA